MLADLDRSGRAWRVTGKKGVFPWVANEIRPTLKQFASVHWVKIYDPSGHTQQPSGHTDSIPECLEP